MRISDWSSGVCSSDLSDLSDEVDVRDAVAAEGRRGCGNGLCERGGCGEKGGGGGQKGQRAKNRGLAHLSLLFGSASAPAPGGGVWGGADAFAGETGAMSARSEEPTAEPPSLMRISYDVCFLIKNT